MLVGFSNAGAARAITEAVLASGRRRIGYVGQVGREHIDRLRDRLDGFRDALAAVGSSFDDRLLVEVDFTFAGGARGLRALLEQAPELEAVVCSSDILALGALFECQRQGIAVPGRLAIGGIDDNDLSPQCVPRLSTVRVPRYRIGRVAGEMICRRLAGQPVPEPIVDLGFELMLRDTI
jgi:LacI family gluconate utilization system Gnt-I transcriptional repressor